MSAFWTITSAKCFDNTRQLAAKLKSGCGESVDNKMDKKIVRCREDMPTRHQHALEQGS